MTFVIPDVLLHSFYVGLVGNITDILRNEFLNIHNWAERNRLFQHTAHLFVMDIPFCQHIRPVLLLRIV